MRELLTICHSGDLLLFRQQIESAQSQLSRKKNIKINVKKIFLSIVTLQTPKNKVVNLYSLYHYIQYCCNFEIPLFFCENDPKKLNRSIANGLYKILLRPRARPPTS